MDNLLSITDAEGNPTLYQYDDLNRRIRTTNAEEESASFAYDLMGNRTERIQTDGTVTLYEQDGVYRLKQVTENFRPGEAPANDVNTETVYSYDARGLLTERRITGQNDPFNRVLDSSYDAASNRTGITYPDGNQMGYAYSPNNWLKTMTVNPVGTRHAVSLQTEYYRDMVGNLTQIVNPNQTETIIAHDKVYRTLERIDRQGTRGGKTNSGFRYTYNQVGHII